MQSFKKTLLPLGLVAVTGLALSTPFWLFNSPDSHTPSSQHLKNLASQQKLAAKEAQSSEKAQDEAKDKSSSSTEQKSEHSLKKQDNSAPAKDGNKAKNPSQEAAAAKADTQTQAPKSVTKDPKAPAADTSNASNNKSEVKADKDAQAKDNQDSKSKEQVASKESAHAKDKDQDKSASKDKSKDSKDTPESKASGQDGYKLAALSNDVLEESSLSEPKDKREQEHKDKTPDNEEHNDEATAALEAKVAQLASKRTSADKKAYEQSLIERKEQVDAAIASISGNYKIYLPPLLSSKAIVVYFSVQTKKESFKPRKHRYLPKLNIDSLSGATTVTIKHDYDEKQNVTMAAMQYIATTLSEESGADLYQISTVINYPNDSSELYDVTFMELSNNIRPELTDDVPLILENYDTVYLCFPNWWSNMPAALYSFLDKYDLSNKVLIPVCLHNGDEFSNTINVMSTLEPNALPHYQNLLIKKEECDDELKLRAKIRGFLRQLSEELN